MMFNEYGSDMERFQLEQQALWRDRMPSELDWNESEVTAPVDPITSRYPTNP